MEMTPERFAALAEAWGGDLTRWPATERLAAAALAARDPTAAETLREAAALDAALAEMAAAPAPPAPPALLAAITRDAVAQAARAAAARRPARWPMAAVMAAAAVVGLALGASGALELAAPALLEDANATDLFAPQDLLATLLEDEA